jgi:hypothetical protein
MLTQTTHAMPYEYNGRTGLSSQIWICAHFAYEVLPEIMHTQDTLLTLAPIAVVAEGVNASML